MIYDKLSNMKLYKGMNPNLDTAIDYILSHDLNELPLGKTVVDGDNVFINVMDAKAFPVEERFYEVHKKYMDIQMDLEGVERIDTGDISSMVMDDFDEDKDVAKATAADLAQCIIGPGNFIICMAGEPHKPNIAVNENHVLKKAVCKVHI
ncbi:MAG: YhcH/YjgK/YiaL family protein [Lachnospiraceae bacterium]|nr:YhcH/YjgK/YiaL family protein [Lachnospiraceae bacterium]